MTINSLNFDAQALREKILDLAMRGKLVKQDPNDEPASVLLEKIKAEKEQLVKEKKIKKTKPLAPITDEEKPFDIPDSWEWVRLGDVASFASGFAYKSKKYVDDSNYQVIRLGNVKNDELKLETQPVFISKEYAEKTKKYKIAPGQILFTMTGTRRKRDYFYTLLVNEEDTKEKKLYLNQRVGCLDNIYIINKIWLNFALKSNIILNEVFKNETGSVNQGNIGSAKTMQISLPLPPLEEQSRIADKIAQLFALLRKVESSNDQYVELQQMLHDKVLDLAMRGKLVEQDPQDEPASELLEKIKTEKAQLVKEKKIKKTKPLPPITDEEKPFDIPDSWEWVRLGDVLTILRGGSPRPIKKYLTTDEGGINWIKIGDTKPGEKYIVHAQEKIIPEGLKKSRAVKAGDFLLSNSMSFGRPYILKIDGAVHDGWLIISNYESLFIRDFLYYLLSSNYVMKQFVTLATGSTVKNLNIDRVAHTIVGVPPKREQEKIVRQFESMGDLLN